MSILRAQRLHILLLLAVLFPLVGPVLVVWWRTVATAGLLAPFPGDHKILKLFFILCLAESTDHEPSPRAKSR
jgi:glycosylphosphatidylinositol deacylase